MRVLVPVISVIVLAGLFAWVLPSSQPVVQPTRFESLAPALQSLYSAVGDGVATGRAHAMLERAFEEHPATSDELHVAWQHPEAALRWGAWLSAGSYGDPDPKFWSAVGEALSQSPPIQRAAMKLTSAVGRATPEPIRQRLVELIRSDNAAVRADALTALQAQPSTPRMWGTFARALGDEDADVREAAARGLSRVPFSDHEATSQTRAVRDGLIRALEDSAVGVRMYAAMALGRMGVEATPALPKLVPMLHDPSSLVRGHAATVLGRVGAPALPHLLDALGQVPDEQVPMVLWALRQIGAPAVPHLLSVSRTDTRTAVRVLAAAKLWELQRPYAEISPVLVRALADEDVNAQLHAARTIERIGAPAADMASQLRQLLALDRTKSNKILQRALTAALHRVTQRVPK